MVIIGYVQVRLKYPDVSQPAHKTDSSDESVKKKILFSTLGMKSAYTQNCLASDVLLKFNILLAFFFLSKIRIFYYTVLDIPSFQRYIVTVKKYFLCGYVYKHLACVYCRVLKTNP
jgi:hypothetical protein